MRDPEVPEQERAQFIAAVVAAKTIVFGSPEKCPFTVNASIVRSPAGHDFTVVIREDTAFTADRLAEIISPHPPLVLLALKATLEALMALKQDAERRSKADEEGGLLV